MAMKIFFMCLLFQLFPMTGLARASSTGWREHVCLLATLAQKIMAGVAVGALSFITYVYF